MRARRQAALVVGVFALAVAASPAHAQNDGCGDFLWPVAKEEAAFARPDLPVVEPGATPRPFGEQAFVLKLKPQAEAKLPLPPSGAPRAKIEKAFAGTVAFGAPSAAATWHVTLSAPGWIDVVQGDAALPAAAHTGAHNCPGVRKSVRFELAKSPLVLQISGAGTDAIKVGIVPAVD